MVDQETSREDFQISPVLSHSLAKASIPPLIISPHLLDFPFILVSLILVQNISFPRSSTCCPALQLLCYTPAFHTPLSSSISFTKAITMIHLLRGNSTWWSYPSLPTSMILWKLHLSSVVYFPLPTVRLLPTPLETHPRSSSFCKVVKHTQHSFSGYGFRTCLRQALRPVNNRAEIFLIVLHIGWYTQKLIIDGIELQFTAGLQGLQSGCQGGGRIAYLGMETASGSALIENTGNKSRTCT